MAYVYQYARTYILLFLLLAVNSDQFQTFYGVTRSYSSTNLMRSWTNPECQGQATPPSSYVLLCSLSTLQASKTSATMSPISPQELEMSFASVGQ